MTGIRRLAKLAAWALAGGVYLWFAAVRNADQVKARKVARRAERTALRTR